MLVKSIEFGGCCVTCVAGDNDTPKRGGVEVALSRDPGDIGEMLCLKCAKRLADRLNKAVADARSRRAAGQEYRHNRWASSRA